MKSTLKIYLLFLALAGITFSCGGDKAADEGKKSSEENTTTGEPEVKEEAHVPVADIPDWKSWVGKGVKIQYPQNWKIEEGSPAGAEFTLFVTGELKSDMEDNLNFTIRQIPGISLEAFTMLDAKSLEASAQIQDVTIKTNEIGKKNGLDFVRFEYVGTAMGVRMAWQQRVFVKGDDAYLLTFTTTEKHYPVLAKEVEKIFDTFSFAN